MVILLRKLAGSAFFQNFVTFVIIFAGILVGIETYPSMMVAYGTQIHFLDALVLTIFTVEVFVKMGAEWPKPWLYFKDPWNCFDFMIVVACFLPIDSQYAVVLRLARLLRVLKLVRALPKLQVLVAALLKSIPSMGYISLFLFLLFYLYAVTSTFLFAENDPIHFGNLQISILSLFRVVTLEDWTDIMYIQMRGCAGYEYYSGNGYSHLCTKSTPFPILAPLFFCSFVLFGTMVILNLFIGVIMNGMDEAREEMEESEERERLLERGLDAPTVEHEIYELRKKLDELIHLANRIGKKVDEQRARGDLK